MSGGTPDGKLIMNSVELFLPSTNTSCWLPDLPEGLIDHVSGGRGLTYCAGTNKWEGKRTHCVDWREGSWVRGAELDKPKRQAFMWSRDTEGGSSSLVMGGCSYCGPKSTVQVTGSSAQPGFDLQYETVSACGVEDEREELVYVVGGGARRSKDDTSRITSIYGVSGYLGDLPALLNTPRYASHGCSGYWRGDNLVLLVAGGQTEKTSFISEKAEMFEVGNSSQWTYIAPLPRAVGGMVGARLDNRVLMTGET